MEKQAAGPGKITMRLRHDVPATARHAQLWGEFIAAVPTCLIFTFCQKIIMRGIVVPVEK